MPNSLSFDCCCDVAVVGGGIAGVAAALQAARSGMKTILIEKTILTGGLATTGLVYFYLPLCDGNGRQVTFGITEELLRASLQYGPGDIPADWHEPGSGRRLQAVFSPAAFVLAMDEMLEKAGVEIWLDTLFCAAELAPDGSRITGIEVENKSGRGRIRAGQFIDASGDCSLARAAGIPCHDDNNFLALWALQYNQQHRNGPLAPALEMRLDGVPWDPATAPPGTIFREIDGKKVTDFVLNGRRLLREYYRQSYQDGRTRQDLFAVKLPAMPQFRKIYSIDARYVLDSGENNRHFDDSIGLVADWRTPGPVWEIPYRTLLPARPLGGFLAAGRNTGARNDAWEVTRVIPPAAMTGQVAGLAAAMAIRQKTEPGDLDVAQLRQELRNAGFPLHLEEIGLPVNK